MSHKGQKGKGNIKIQKLRWRFRKFRSEYPNHHRQPWTEGEKDLLVSLYKKQLPIGEIASRLGRREDAIVHKLINIEIIGYPNDQIPNRHDFIWSISEINRLRNEVRKRRGLKQIAMLHQRTRNAILHRMIELRLFDIENRQLLDKYREGEIEKLRTKAQELSNEYSFLQPLFDIVSFIFKH